MKHLIAKWKYLVFGSAASALCVVTFVPGPASAADEWVVRVVSTSRSCNVQLKTERPALGSDFKTGFATRKAACQEAKNQYDGTLSDPNKCWTYGGGTVRACGSEGISLGK